MRLSRRELERYSRQLSYRELGKAGQKKLKKASVLVVGAGGLGSSISLYLTAAGVGKLRLVELDRLELSNLNRQILYEEGDVGEKKVKLAKERLSKLNSEVEIEALDKKVQKENLSEVVSGMDGIVDATDNFETRYLLNEASFKEKVPFFHGAVEGLEGRASTIIPGETACFRCLYPEPPTKKTPPVIGTTAGIIGEIQATEVIKYFAGIGKLLKNELLIYNGRRMEFRKVKVKKDPKCPVCSNYRRK